MFMIIVDKILMRVVLYSNLRLNFVIMFFCFLFSFFIVFEIILMEEKLVKDIRKIEIILIVWGERLLEILLRFIIVINLFVISFVVIMLLVVIILELGILIRNVIGVNI